jgi:hypothetical protein
MRKVRGMRGVSCGIVRLFIAGKEGGRVVLLRGMLGCGMGRWRNVGIFLLGVDARASWA